MIARLAAVLGAAIFLAACASADSTASPSASSSSDAPTSTSSTVPEVPAPPRYRPLPGEPVPELKSLAADVLQAIGTYPVGGGTAAAARQRLDGRGDPSLSEAVLPLLDPSAASSVEIVYPQLGGLTATDASVMIVYRHRLVTMSDEQELTRTADIRLNLRPEGWIVSSIDSLGGGPPTAPITLSPAAEAVLADDAIDLPDTARWDIDAGRVDERILRLLTELAAEHSIGVTVFSTGHPRNVFGTEHLSNHTGGRGVDVWSVDGEPVIAQRNPTGPLQALVQQLVDEKLITELGSPWDLDGAGTGASFTNTVHQDHLHLAFDG